MRVTLFGTGYVGLVTGACLAEVGNDVVCVDIDEAKIEGLRRGVVPIFEPGLEELVKANQAAGRLRFSTDSAAGVAHGEVLFIAVGTPPDEDGSADLRHVLEVARMIGQHLDRPAVIVDKSTVPVGTGDRVREAIAVQLAARAIDIAFDVVSNPEFLKEGDAVKDCMRPDRIIIGTDAPHAIEEMKRLYAPFNRNHERLVIMDMRSAELTKYAANAMLATKISFMNEMANIAERVGADIEMVRHGIGSDPRIGYAFIYPGAGYGGSCFPKDVQALDYIAKQHGYAARILTAVEAVNRAQKSRLFELVQAHFGQDLAGKRFALWGLAFKPNTDDLRDAPAIDIIRRLQQRGAIVKAHDPIAMPRFRNEHPDLATVLCDTPQAAIAESDAVVLTTEWNEYRDLDWSALAITARGKHFLDTRFAADAAIMQAAGWQLQRLP